MSKAFTKESDQEEPLQDLPLLLPPGTRNYMTPAGAQALLSELKRLLDSERPQAAQDTSDEGKTKLSQIDRRIRFLSARQELLEVVDPAHQDRTQVRFGAKVSLTNEASGKANGEASSEESESRQYEIVGIDEADPNRNRISWISPLAKILLGKKIGDIVALRVVTKSSRAAARRSEIVKEEFEITAIQ